MAVKALKFGGSSLASAAQFQKVAEIIKADDSRRYVVASAPGKRFADDIKVTDMLYECFKAARKKQDIEPIFAKIEQRYNEIIAELGLDFSLDEEFAKIKFAISHHVGEDYTASRGEYLNSMILAKYLGYDFIDAETGIFFKDNGTFDAEHTNDVLSIILKEHERAVIPGFYGLVGSRDDNTDVSGDPARIKTFARGGSDVTGSLVAAAVNADLYENWTDVSGLMAADPRIVEGPRTVKYVSYRELRTLSYMGASILHTDAVLPVADMSIPINIRNTDRPGDPGTTIVRKLPKGETKYPIIGVAGRTGMSVIQVEKVMVSDESGFTAVMLEILKNRQIPFEQCLTGIDTVTLVIKSDVLAPFKQELFTEIRAKLNPDYLGLTEHLSMIAVIGEKGTDSCDANVRVLQALADMGMPISTVNQGAGKLNLLIGVPEDRYEEAIRTIYATIGEA